MCACAIWRRLDVAGHDAALLTADGSGWSLADDGFVRRYPGLWEMED